MSFLTDNLPYIHRVPERLLNRWKWRFWPMLILELSAYFIVPFISVFVRYEVRTDTMKRLAKEQKKNAYTQYTKMREYLPMWANWFQTHDNAADEFYWGNYDSWFNDTFGKYYNDSKVVRYINRVLWHWRNKAYGASYTAFGAPKGTDEPDVWEFGKEDSGELWVCIKTANDWFHYEAQIPNDDGKYRGVNIGWKANRSAPPLEDGTYNVMYANRLAWLRRKEYK